VDSRRYCREAEVTTLRGQVLMSVQIPRRSEKISPRILARKAATFLFRLRTPEINQPAEPKPRQISPLDPEAVLMAALNMAALLVAIVGPPCARPQSPRPPPTLPLPRPRLARRIAFDALGSRALPLPRCTGPIAPRAIKPRTSNPKGMPPLGARTPTPSDTHTAALTNG